VAFFGLVGDGGVGARARFSQSTNAKQTIAKTVAAEISAEAHALFMYAEGASRAGGRL
jgi:hypothetical protein